MEYSELLAGIRDSIAGLIAWLRAQQPRIAGAAALLVIGWLLALGARLLASRLIMVVGRMVPQRLLRRGLPQLTMERQISRIIGLVAFWAVLLFFLAAAADTLGLPVLSTSLVGFGFYLPRLLGAILIAVVGLILGNLAREAVTATASAAGAPFATAVGQIVRAAILTAAGLIAVAELGIDITLLTAVLSVTLLAVLGAFSLAFGLGARTAVSNIIGAHYLRQRFAIGEEVRFGEIDGIISDITAVSVIVRVPDGEVVIPAKQFTESISMLKTPGGPR
ncbi:MAG TPA: mechanosensitive ion channel domain-containing protein [Vicinamibacterales bacterium]|nr:mechanosensitive ion channel domain-containing protein [Vicinamibacterales bacterium]